MLCNLSEEISKIAEDKIQKVGTLISLGKCIDWNSKLCRWNSNSANEKSEQAYSNQALNTLYNYATRGFTALDTTWFSNISNAPISGSGEVQVSDAREIRTHSDIWMTDPPYADAVNYHELSEL